MSADWDALRELFDGALERPVDERAAYLNERTQGNDALRRDIESLLAAHGDADEFLSAPAFSPSPTLPSTLPLQAVATHSGASTRLTAGSRLGAFEILALLGTGGMGEVYRARDTRLDRFVAIKVLSSDIDMAPRGRERFEREARAISKLSHPRICTVHDIGVAEIDGRDVPYLVMELLDGETLAARIARGPLPVEQALSYGIDIADALVVAHGQGIVHRDLKPANVIVTSTGVKLLDFGLAQLRKPDGAIAHGAAPSADPTLTSAGMVFGTIPYMSPEQLRGERVDTRSDVFAFGALLHEMLTGRRPFHADSEAGLIAAILEHQAPAVRDLQPLASSGLDRIVRKCLAKDPDDRWQTARDLKSELIWVREEREESARARTPLPATRHRRRWLQVLVMGVPAIAAVLLAVMLWRAAATPALRRVTRLALNLPPGVTLEVPVNGTSFAIAPDGSRIAFLGTRNGRQSLFIHTLETGETLDVPETRDAVNPTFSPDSQWVAFAQRAVGVRKVLAAGGPIQLVWAGAANQLTWLADDRIVFASGSRPLREIGDADNAITTLGEGDDGHSTPLLMRDGSLLFTIRRGSVPNSIAVWPPPHVTEAGKARELVPNATTPRLLDEAIVFAQGRSLMAAGFDSRAIRLSSEPRALDLQVQTTRLSAFPMYALSNNGTLVYAKPAAGRRLVWVDRSGHEEYLKTDARMFLQLRLSPDGTRIAAGVGDPGSGLWIFSADGAIVHRLTSGGMPVWSPDGSKIFFTTAQRKIGVIPADRSKPPEIFFELPPPQRLHATSITPDGKRLLMHWDLMPKEIDLRVLELGPPPALTLLMGDSQTEHDGQLSRDGRWVAYQSDETTGGVEGQILVSRFPDVRAERHVISEGLARHPIWSRDGRTVYYRTEDGTVMSVAITTSPSFKKGPPVRVVTPVNTLQEPTGPTYDVSPDGQRFLFIKSPENDIRSLEVILNWDVEVKEVLAGKRP